MQLEKKELLNIIGGGLTGTIINAIIKGATTVVDFGRNIGSAIRRITFGKLCPI